jgi:hypothetical protein
MTSDAAVGSKYVAAENKKNEKKGENIRSVQEKTRDQAR